MLEVCFYIVIRDVLLQLELLNVVPFLVKSLVKFNDYDDDNDNDGSDADAEGDDD